jgi:hypothetical protein
MDSQKVHNANQKATILAKTFESKFRSKKDIYLLLTVDAKAYLPSNDDLTIYFMKELLTGDKKVRYLFFLINCIFSLSNAKMLFTSMFPSIKT